MTTEELKNAAGFKAVDAEGNDLGVVTLSDIVTAVKEELAQSQPAARAASVSTLSEVSALAATDTYEDQLPQKTDVNWVRGLDAEGNPVLISKQSLASVVEELIPEATFKSKGLMRNRMSFLKYVDKEKNTIHISINLDIIESSFSIISVVFMKYNDYISSFDIIIASGVSAYFNNKNILSSSPIEVYYKMNNSSKTFEIKLKTYNNGAFFIDAIAYTANGTIGVGDLNIDGYTNVPIQTPF